MAILFMEGFDHYGTAADLVAKWSSGALGAGATFPAGQGGTGKALQLQFSSSQHQVQRMFHPTTNYATVIIGLWFQASSFNHSADRTIFYIEDNNGGVNQASLHHDNSGNLQVCRGSGGTTVLATSAATMSVNTWHHIEAKYTIHNSAGAAIIKLDGSEVINISGVDLATSANDFCDAIRIFSCNANNGITKQYDHLFVLDTSGSVNNDFIGQATVKALYPTGAGASTQWTPNSGTNHAAVDEIGQDGDTSYVAAATAGHKDLYAFGDLDATEQPLAVEVFAVTKKDDGTARTFATTMRSGSTDADGATYTQTTSYDYVEQYRDTDPDTSAAWTKSGFDALQAGVKVVS